MNEDLRSTSRQPLRTAFRLIAAVFFIGAGLNHFRSTAFYERIIPPRFPSPHGLVIVSGLFEIVGGIGLLIPRLRRAAGIGLIALLVAVFPANLNMAFHADQFADLQIPRWGFWGRMVQLPLWAFWARLPLQGVFIAWVWYVGVTPPSAKTHL